MNTNINAVAFKILLKQNSTHVALAEGGALTGRDRKRSALETYLNQYVQQHGVTRVPAAFRRSETAVLESSEARL